MNSVNDIVIDLLPFTDIQKKVIKLLCEKYGDTLHEYYPSGEYTVAVLLAGESLICDKSFTYKVNQYGFADSRFRSEFNWDIN